MSQVGRMLCPNCNQSEFSDQQQCPICGYQNNTIENKKERSPLKIVGMSILIVGILVVAGFVVVELVKLKMSENDEGTNEDPMYAVDLEILSARGSSNSPYGFSGNINITIINRGNELAKRELITIEASSTSTSDIEWENGDLLPGYDMYQSSAITLPGEAPYRVSVYYEGKFQDSVNIDVVPTF